MPVEIVSSAGDDAIGLAEVAGLTLDPWQKNVMRGSLSERRDGTWSAFEVGLITPRQNGKNSCLEVRELAGLYLFNEEMILHSAHEFNTADEQFIRIKFLIGQSSELTKRVRRILNGHGMQQIELKPTATIIAGPSGKFVKYSKSPRLKFNTRTAGAGRGFTGDCIILDEAYQLPRRVISALLPTISAKKNGQIWYTSSAVDKEVHEHGIILAGVRERGLNRSSPRLYYAEWSADETRYDFLAEQAKRQGRSWRTVAGDKGFLQESNPGLGHRISEDVIEAELQAMPEKTFKVERLCIGDWPPVDGASNSAIDLEKWHQLMDATSKRSGDCAIGVDISPHREHAALALYSLGGTGVGHAQLVFYGPTNKLVEQMKVIKNSLNPLAWAMGYGTFVSLQTELEDNEFKRPEKLDDFTHGDVMTLNGTMMHGACGHILDAVRDGTMKIKPDKDHPEILDDAAAGAILKEGADTVAWSRKSKSDITPIVALTCARWGFVSRVDNLKSTEFFGSWR